MEFALTELHGVYLLTPNRFEDERGYFSETFSARDYAEAGHHFAFVQDNESLSRKAGTVRGLHYQAPPHAQGKLVRCLTGSILDVAVDIRRGSPTFGMWVSFELSAENGHQLLIPRGFLHGFLTLKPDTIVIYKCDDYYAPDCDGAVRFDDPDLAIDWGIDKSRAIISQKDVNAPLMRDFNSPFVFES